MTNEAAISPIGSIVAEGWRAALPAFRKNALPLLALILFGAVVDAVDASRPDLDVRGLQLLNSLASVVISIFVLKAASEYAMGRSVAGKWFGSGFVTLGTGIVVLVGLVCFIAPGFWLLGRLQPATAMYLLEQPTPAYEASWTLTRGKYWPSLKIGLIEIALFLAPLVVYGFGIATAAAFGAVAVFVTSAVTYSGAVFVYIATLIMALRWAQYLIEQSHVTPAMADA